MLLFCFCIVVVLLLCCCWYCCCCCCCCCGSNVTDMHHYITPLLKKEPDHILLHIGSNSAPYETSAKIMDDIMTLKKFIEEKLPRCNVIISQPTILTYDMKAHFTLQQVSNKIERLNLKHMNNSNITDVHLGKKGLHLNGRGTGRLALNIISLIKEL